MDEQTSILDQAVHKKGSTEQWGKTQLFPIEIKVAEI